LRSSTTTTWWPASTHRSTTWDPTKPAPPVIRIFTWSHYAGAVVRCQATCRASPLGRVRVQAKVGAMTASGATATGREPAGLGRLFAPRTIALIGVPGDLSRPGARPLHFLRRHGYQGHIYLVNPGYRVIGDLPVYPSVGALPESPDVAWIGLPAARAADALTACGQAGVPFAVVLGAGFAETGESGAEEQARLVESARRAGVRLLGPNTVGFVNAWDRVALTFSTVGKLEPLAPGPVAVLSQSGGLGGCLVDRAADRGLGVGLFVSTGNEADLSLADYLEWLVDGRRARALAWLVQDIPPPQP